MGSSVVGVVLGTKVSVSPPKVPNEDGPSWDVGETTGAPYAVISKLELVPSKAGTKTGIMGCELDDDDVG